MASSQHKPPDARISERLRLCQENVDESPYSHPVAVDWYLQDIDHLIARLHQEASTHRVVEKRLEEQFDALHRLAQNVRDGWLITSADDAHRSDSTGGAPR